MLFDTNQTYALLTALEEVDAGVSVDPETYLGQLSDMIAARTSTAAPQAEPQADGERASKRTKTDTEGRQRYAAAKERMEEIRLACARHLARAMVDGLDARY